MQDGRYFTTKPAFTANGRIRPQVAIIKGNAERFDSVTYVLRYVRDGKPTWETVGSDPALALSALARKNHALEGAKLGIASLPEVEEDEPEAPAAAVSVSHRKLSDAVTEYLGWSLSIANTYGKNVGGAEPYCSFNAACINTTTPKCGSLGWTEYAPGATGACYSYVATRWLVVTRPSGVWNCIGLNATGTPVGGPGPCTPQ